MIRNVLLAALWFVLVFVLGLLWFYPVDAVVASQVRTLEDRTGLRIHWRGERWSVWRSELTGVTVTDRNGHEWLHLARLEMRPRFDGLYVQGQADWGGIKATVRSGASEMDIEGYPVPRPTRFTFEDGRLNAHIVYEQALFKAHGRFNLNGRTNIAIYNGPISLSGTFELNDARGLASLEVLGDRLRGHGDVSIDATGGHWSRARVNGPMRIEQKGAVYPLKLSGQVDNLTLTTQ